MVWESTWVCYGDSETMNPKAAETWNFALAKMRLATEHIANDNDEMAKTEIAKAVYVGAGALYYLYGACEQERTAYQAAQGFISDLAADEDCSGADAHQAAKKILGLIAQLAPEESPLPIP